MHISTFSALILALLCACRGSASTTSAAPAPVASAHGAPPAVASPVASAPLPTAAPSANAPALSASPVSEPVRVTPAPAASNPALERALASVDSQKIRADIFFIASDELEGRDTPSRGQRLAARYIRARLERLGFQPAGDDGFFDRYELEQSGLDLGASKAWCTRGDQQTALVFGQDYAFFGAGTHELDGEVVFVGAGQEAELAGVDLKGMWALVIDMERPPGEARMQRMQRVQAAGALGLLSAPDASAKDVAERDARLAQFASFSREPQLHPLDEERSPAEDFPSLSLTSKLASELLGSAGSAQAGRALGVRFHELRTQLTPERVGLENVAGLWPGSDPELAQEVLILSAHYDHVGLQGGEIYNGADDNGSGTCGLMALAEALKSYGPLKRSVLLLWVSGEEKGLLGSQAWTEHPTLAPGLRPVSDINIDMIGRNAPDKLLITPTKALPEYNGLTRLAESLAPLEGFPVLGSCDEYWQRSDHMNFADHLKIPVAFLFSDVHEDYHQPTDDPEKIDCDKIRRVTRLVLRMLDGLQGDPLSL
ncbi:MAG: M28 family peptidase [Planctomycetes bacterium]|nr:M28 family peptidase [Planctomycetota bacterium]